MRRSEVEVRAYFNIMATTMSLKEMMEPWALMMMRCAPRDGPVTSSTAFGSVLHACILLLNLVLVQQSAVGGDVGTLIDEGPSANSFHRDQRATFVSAFRLQSGTLDGSRVDPTSSSFCGVTEVIGVTIGAQRNGESVVGSRDLWRTEVHLYESWKKNNRI